MAGFLSTGMGVPTQRIGAQPARPIRATFNPLGAMSANLSKRQTKRVIASATSGGSGGNVGSGGSSGGGGGGGGGDGQGGDQPKKKGGGGAFFWKGWEERVAADPEFPFKVFLEQVIGVGASVVGDMSGRPNWGLNELDFVFSTLVVGSIINFSLMYLLAPTAPVAGAAAAAAASSGFLSKMLSESTLRGWGAPGSNMFEPGGYSVGGRLLNFGYKGLIFGTIGVFAGTIGTTMSNGLLMLRKKLDPAFVLQNSPPDVLPNAMCWGAHMAFSSNFRYQVLGGTDRILVTLMPNLLFKAYSTIIRSLNNILGGISFVTIARLAGVQKSAATAAAPAAPAPAATASTKTTTATKAKAAPAKTTTASKTK